MVEKAARSHRSRHTRRASGFVVSYSGRMRRRKLTTPQGWLGRPVAASPRRSTPGGWRAVLPSGVGAPMVPGRSPEQAAGDRGRAARAVAGRDSRVPLVQTGSGTGAECPPLPRAALGRPPSPVAAAGPPLAAA